MNTLIVIKKDLKIILKDREALAVLFLMPLMFGLIMGTMAQTMGGGDDESGDTRLTVTAYLVNEDAGPYGAQVAAGLKGAGVLDIVELDTVQQADQKVADGAEPAAIVIPADFSQNMATLEPTQVHVIVDPAQKDAARIVSAVMDQAVIDVGLLGEISYGVSAVIAGLGLDDQTRQLAEAQTLDSIWSMVQEIRQQPLIAIKSENTQGEETSNPFSDVAFTIPANATIFAFLLMGFMAKALLTEKEQGSFRRLLASPVHRGSFIAGKMLTYAGVVFLQVAMMFGVGRVAFGMPLGNSPLGLLLLTLAVALAATSLGMLIGALARTSEQGSALGTVLAMVLMAVGGCIMPASKLGEPIYTLSRLTPHAHTMEGFTQLLNRGADLAGILPQLAALVGMSVVFFLVAMRRFEFE
jgi:ABC-2 type transport system permease protein